MYAFPYITGESLLFGQDTRQPEGDARHERDHQKCNEEHGQERHCVLCNARNGDLGKRLRHKKVGANRRSHKSDCKVAGHKDTEVDDIYIVSLNDWQEDRRKDQNARNRIHQHTGNQQEQIDGKENRNLAFDVASNERCKCLRDAKHGQNTTKHNADAEDQHDRGSGMACVDQTLDKLFEVHLTVSDYADEQSIDN